MAAVDQPSTGATEDVSRDAELARLQELLVDAEQRAASIPELQRRIGALEAALAQAREDAHDLRRENQRLDERLMQADQVLVDVMSSPSWKLTEPLRRAKQLLN